MSADQPPKDDPKARTFKDMSGKSWTLLLNRKLLLQIRRNLQVDLGDLENFTKTWAGLLLDDDLCYDVLWEIISQSATDKDAWLENMDGESLEKAKDALHAAVFFFTQPSQRKALKMATDALMKGYRETIADAEQILAEMNEEADIKGMSALGTRWLRSAASSDTSTRNGRLEKGTRRSKRGGRKNSNA